MTTPASTEPVERCPDCGRPAHSPYWLNACQSDTITRLRSELASVRKDIASRALALDDTGLSFTWRDAVLKACGVEPSPELASDGRTKPMRTAEELYDFFYDELIPAADGIAAIEADRAAVARAAKLELLEQAFAASQETSRDLEQERDTLKVRVEWEETERLKLLRYYGPAPESAESVNPEVVELKSRIQQLEGELAGVRECLPMRDAEMREQGRREAETERDTLRAEVSRLNAERFEIVRRLWARDELVAAVKRHQDDLESEGHADWGPVRAALSALDQPSEPKP